MRMRERARMLAAGDQSGEMRHVDQEIGADLVGDLAEARELDEAAVGRAAGDDELRPVLAGKLRHLVDVDAPVLLAHAVLHRLEPFARQVRRRAVRQMAAGVEAHAQNRVAGLGERQEHRLVRLAAGVRLHVGEAAAEEPRHPLDRELLGHVDVLAAAVIAPARIALGVFVGHHRALRLEHGARHDVLRGDQLDLVLLAAELGGDRRGDRRIGLQKRGGEECVWSRRRPGRFGVRHVRHPVRAGGARRIARLPNRAKRFVDAKEAPWRLPRGEPRDAPVLSTSVRLLPINTRQIRASPQFPLKARASLLA